MNWIKIKTLNKRCPIVLINPSKIIAITYDTEAKQTLITVEGGVEYATEQFPYELQISGPDDSERRLIPKH